MNEGSAIGVHGGIADSTSTSPITGIGHASGSKIKAAIRDGSLAGAITQDPIEIGAKCVETAPAAIAGNASRTRY